jgi:hypothetical protein
MQLSDRSFSYFTNTSIIMAFQARKTKSKITWGTSAKDGAALLCQSRWFTQGYSIVAEDCCIYLMQYKSQALEKRPVATIRFDRATDTFSLHWKVNPFSICDHLNDRVIALLGINKPSDASAYRTQFLETEKELSDRVNRARKRLKSRQRPDKRTRERIRIS